MDSKPTKLYQFWLGFAWLQFIFLLGAITFLSLTPDPGDSFDSFSDKFLHIAGWFMLLLSLHVAVRQKILPWYWVILLWAYSGLIEVMQGLMPPREMSLLDLLANGLGIGVALGCIYLVAPLYWRWILQPLLIYTNKLPKQ